MKVGEDSQKRVPGTWYPTRLRHLVSLGNVLGVLPWSRSGRWSPGNVIYGGFLSMLMISCFLATYVEYQRIFLYPRNISWLCELASSIVSLTSTFTILSCFWSQRKALCLVMKESRDVQCMRSTVSRWPLLLAGFKVIEMALDSYWYSEEFVTFSAPLWVKVVFPLTHWYHAFTSIYPILLYIGLTDHLTDRATLLNSSLGDAMGDQEVEGEGLKAPGHHEDKVEDVVKEWHHLFRLHRSMEKVLNVPLLAALTSVCVELLTASFFLAELSNVRHTVLAGLMITFNLTLLHVQGHVSDALNEQAQEVNRRLRYYLTSDELPPAGSEDHLYITQVSQLAEETGDPLEINLIGIYKLSLSNFLPAVGATVAHLVILLQFYLADVSSVRASHKNAANCTK